MPKQLSSNKQIKKKKPVKAVKAKDVDNKEFGYNIKGKTIPIDSEDCLAKSVTRLGFTWYWLKKGTQGPIRGSLLNPFVRQETFHHVFKDKELYEWSRVTNSQFDAYVKFLKTKDPAYLRQAERPQ